ncbi:hypothetical protein QBC40DRAFT_72035 [Triangularia verruculosa]|uniref:Uncharacterized protein n=1 Tax=Triangularia verruculosa TaxID=2587418 RepID=A0AAN7AWT8_9PEZI|nr:hypothetical protein QBC40DRAFT_72035 [Triangularia verruculosa]
METIESPKQPPILAGSIQVARQHKHALLLPSLAERHGVAGASMVPICGALVAFALAYPRQDRYLWFHVLLRHSRTTLGNLFGSRFHHPIQTLQLRHPDRCQPNAEIFPRVLLGSGGSCYICQHPSFRGPADSSFPPHISLLGDPICSSSLLSRRRPSDRSPSGFIRLQSSFTPQPPPIGIEDRTWNTSLIIYLLRSDHTPSF